MNDGARTLPDITWLESDDAKERLRRVLRAHRRTHHPHAVPVPGHPLVLEEHGPECEAFTENALEAVGSASTVAAYVSVGSEPCTRLLLTRLEAAGVTVLLPVLGPRLGRCWGRFLGTEDLAERAPGRPPEPSGPVLPAVAVADAELLLVPALAVDRAGNRLGQGGGWYDRMIPLTSPTAPVCAMVYPDETVRVPLPVEAHDRKVDAVVTSQEWFLLEGSAFAAGGTGSTRPDSPQGSV